jgi:hypothetical protein
VPFVRLSNQLSSSAWSSGKPFSYLARESECAQSQRCFTGCFEVIFIWGQSRDRDGPCPPPDDARTPPHVQRRIGLRPDVTAQPSFLSRVQLMPTESLREPQRQITCNLSPSQHKTQDSPSGSRKVALSAACQDKVCSQQQELTEKSLFLIC